MPRNASGIYTLPGGNPVTPGDVIEASWANTTLEDVADALTNSLSRTGAGGMLAPFRIADGSISAPGLSYLNETNTGLYRSGSGSTWMAVLGVNTFQFSTVGVTVPLGKALTVISNASVGGTLSVTGATTLASTLAVTGAITATGGVVGNVTGNVTAASGTSTFNDVVITGSLDMTAGSSATITGLSTPTNASDAANKGYVDTQDALKLSLTGGTMSGNIAMGGNLITGMGAPSAGGDATNKTYVDAQVATRLALAGGTMSGAIAMGNNKITGLATPTADADGATKAYVDSVAQGLDVKASCRAATVANITLSGTQTIDGVAVIAGDRVLVKDQSTAANNGIYVVAAGSWSRAADADTWAELVGAFTFVEDGTVNDNSGWVCTSAPGGTLGVTAVTFEQFSGAGQITAGAGLTKTGNTLNVGTASSSRIVVNTDDIDLATTGVTASTYKSVTVDAYGRVTAGTNPTTLVGFGITDAYTSAQTDTLLAAKLSLTGGTMSGNLAMGGFKVTGLGAPSNAADAATKDYTDTGLALKLNLAGGTMSGAIAMGTNKITGLGDPTLAQDAATKNYIDTIFGSTTSAAASAAAAASSASSASSSATSASASASSASSSAAAAAASYDSFDDRYLGAKASDPTVDNDGNALLTGALYWNTTSNQMRVYDGSAWVVAYLPASGYAQLGSTNTFTANQIITANTSSDALKITQTGSGNALYIEDVAADATPFVVSSTGVLGIGTTTPDNVTSAGIALVSNAGYYPQLIQRNTTVDSNASYIGLEKSRNGAVVQNGDILGNIVFRGYDGTQFLQGAAMWAAISATPGTNDMPTDIVFGTTPDGGSGISERLRISSTGAGTATQDWTFQSVRVGRGAGAVATNTAVGASALAANTTGYENVALGSAALIANTTGFSNIAVGTNALVTNVSGQQNTALGHQVLYANTGSYNTGAGSNTLRFNTSGANNTAFGFNSLFSNTTSSYNVAVGYQAGYSNTTGGIHAFGDRALYSNTTGSANTAAGSLALSANTTGYNNTAVGLDALKLNTTGYFNTAIGTSAGTANTTGIAIVAVGQSALLSNTTGNRNIAIGSNDGVYTSPLRWNATGSDNIAIGTGAIGGNGNCSLNVAIGTGALGANTTATANTAVGYLAGNSITNAGGNTMLGHQTGISVTTGTENVFVGHLAGTNGIATTTGIRNTVVGPYARCSSATSNNEVVIGIDAQGKGSSTGFISPNGGGVYQGNNSSSWSTTSDRRLKKNIADNNDGLDKINSIRVRNFEYRLPEEVDAELKPTDAIKKSGVQLGVIAQELQAVLPECVKQESTGVLSVDTDNLTWYLINAVKELSARVKQLEGN